MLGLSLLAVSGLALRANVEFGQVLTWIDLDPLRALQANVRAHEMWPWDQRYRRQLVLTLETLAVAEPERTVISDEAWDRAFEISATASPSSPATIAARLSYLLRSGRWRERSEETETLLANLKAVGGEQPTTWLLEAVHAAWMGDGRRAVAAVQNGLAITGAEPEELAPLRELATQAGLEIEE